MEKKELIEYFLTVVKNLEEDNISQLQQIARTENIAEIATQLRKHTALLKEKTQVERLTAVFNEYLIAIENGTVEKFLEENDYDSIKEVRKEVNYYLHYYGTKEDKEKYEKVTLENRTKQSQEKLKTDLKNPKYKYVKEIQRILTDDNNEVLMEYLEMELENWKLKDWVNKYCLYYNPTEEERQKLQNAIEIYSKMRNERGKEKSKETWNKTKQDREERKIKEVLPCCKELIEILILSKKSIDVYCEINKIKKEEIKRSLDIIMRFDKEKYEMYMAKIEKNTQEEAKNNLLLALQMQDMIQNGIEEDGVKRNFDIVDYYVIAQISFPKFINSVKKVIGNERDILPLKIFITDLPGNNTMPLNEEKILNSKNLILIDGEEIEITRENKLEFINYMKQNNVPLTEYNYYTLKDRFINKLKQERQKQKAYS